MLSHPAAGGTPQGSAMVTPSASCISEDSDLTHGQQWWLPQPKASLDEDHTEWRPAVPLAEALQCKVCNDLLKEAMTAAECGHSYCYDCIDERITVGGRANFCPVCNLLLGPNPFEHNKLKYDFTLDSLVRKIFPRPKLDAALDARRLEREEATRQAKANINKRPGRPVQGRVVSSSQLAALGSGRLNTSSTAADSDQVEVALFPASPPDAAEVADGQAAAATAVLPKPYIRAPGSMTVAALRSWLSDRVAGKKADAFRLSLRLSCAGQTLDLAMPLQQVHETVWKPRTAGSGAVPSGSAADVAGATASEIKSGVDLKQHSRVMLVYYSDDAAEV